MRLMVLLILAFISLGSKRPEKASMCESCHGAGGKTPMNYAIPKLASQSSFYLEKQLKDFRSGYRQSPEMKNITKTLTDEEIKNLARYFADQSCK